MEAKDAKIISECSKPHFVEQDLISAIANIKRDAESGLSVIEIKCVFSSETKDSLEKLGYKVEFRSMLRNYITVTW